MQISILLPCEVDALRGNSTTAQRIMRGLVRSHHQVECLAIGADLDTKLHDDCDLVIALHAGKTGPRARQLAKARKIPLVILFTGTDLNGRPSEDAKKAVASAAALVTLGTSAAKRVRTLFDDSAKRLNVIMQAVSPLPEKRGAAIPQPIAELAEDIELILLPTGVRAVKDPMRAITALAPLAASRAKLRLMIIGEAMDEQLSVELQKQCEVDDFASYLGPISRDQLAAYMRRANVVISTSKSEGGPPNALLEAGLLARPLLATDIPAHREFPGGNRLFKDDRALRRKVAELLDNPRDAQIAAISMREDVRQGFAAAREAAAWIGLVHKFNK